MVTVATHHDADGIASLCLFIEAQSAHIEYEFPDEFGGTTEDTDVVLDMTPDPEFGGKVIDHHPQHEDEEDRNYELFFGHKPASILTLEKYRDKIDRNEYWKVMTGAVGDMAPEKVPSYVWREEPSLLDTISYFKGYSGDDKISFRLPKFKKLSSGINSLCKIDMPEKAVNVLHRSDSPDDLIYNKECENARSEVRKEEKESFTDVINKLTKERSLTEIAGILSEDEADRLEERIKERREKTRDRIDDIKDGMEDAS